MLLDNVIFAYHLDGNGRDSSSFANNGTESGITWVSGKLNQCGTFNGSARTFASDMSHLKPTTALSLSAWFKSSTTQSNKYIVAKPLAGINNGWDINIVNSTTMGAILAGCTPSTFNITTSTNDGNWHHFVVTFGSGSVKIYLDGVNVLTNNSVTGSLSTAVTFLTIGAFNNTGLNGFTGDIDEVCGWNRALSSTEVSQLWNGGNGLTFPFGTGMFQFFLQ